MSPSSTASASSWPPATIRRCSARTARASIDRPGGRHVHRPGARERLRRQRRLPVSAARRHVPAAAGGRAGRRQARRGGRSHASSAIRAGPIQAEDQAARDGRPRSSASSPQDAGGICPSAVPVPPVGVRQCRSRSSRNDTPQTATPGPSCRPRSTASSPSRATSITSASRRRRARPSTSTATPAGSARRSIR